MTASLEMLISQARAVLLDFDGPVCRLFSERPNYVAASKLRTFLEDQGVTLPRYLDNNRSPLKLLEWTGTAHPDLAAKVDNVLTEEETLAAASAHPTPGTPEALARFAAAGMPVAIVSNNSAQAVTAYLRRHELHQLVTTIVGRPYGRPQAMKPAPDPLIDAMRQLQKRPETCVFIGDAPTDVQAARAGGVVPIGYARTRRHHAALTTAGADLIIDDMAAFLGISRPA